MRLWHSVLIVAAVAASLAPVSSVAQPGPDSPGPPGGAMRPPERPMPPPDDGPGSLFGDDMDKKDLQELVEMVMMVRVSRELGLNEEETVVMVRRFQDFRAHVADLNANRQKALKDLKQAVKAGASDDEITRKLSDLMSADTEVQTAKQKALEKVSGQLTPTQRAKLYLLMQDFEAQMRRMIARVRERRHRGFDEFQGPPPQAGPGPAQRPGVAPWVGRQGPLKARRPGGPRPPAPPAGPPLPEAPANLPPPGQ